MAYYKDFSKHLGKYSTVNISWNNRVWYIIPTVRICYSDYIFGMEFFFLGLSVVYTRHTKKGREVINAYKQNQNK